MLRSPPKDGVVTLTLNRADKKNALSIAVRNEMSDALDDLAGDEAVKSVVVTGAGNVFSAGFDLREFQQPELTDQLWASSDRFHGTVLRFPLPVIAAVNGPAIGGGFELALACDLIIAAEHVEFAMPEGRVGNVADAGGVHAHDLGAASGAGRARPAADRTLRARALQRSPARC